MIPQDEPNEVQRHEREVFQTGKGSKIQRRNFFKPKRAQKKAISTILKHRREPAKESKGLEKIETNIFEKIIQQVNVSQKGQVAGWGVKGQLLQICNILKYMLGQSMLEGRLDYQDKQYKTIQKWQAEQIIKQADDTNLGDFMVKCPNPDNLPDDWKEKYKVQEQDGVQKSNYQTISVGQAMQFYYDLFDLENSSRLESQKENIAFLLAYYFLKYKVNPQLRDPIADSALKIYEFYKIVENIKLKQYLPMRQQQSFYDKYQYIVEDMFREQYLQLPFLLDSSEIKDYHQSIWKHFKVIVYSNLNQYLLLNLQEGSNLETQECKVFFAKVKSISQLLKTFPDIIARILSKIKSLESTQQPQQEDQQQQLKSSNKLNKDIMVDSSKTLPKREGQRVQQSVGKDKGRRDLFWGQYLKKTVVKDDVIWVNTKSRPNDVATLLRFCLLYKLTIKSKLYARMFLNKDQTHIMIVVKASEQILQSYAQKNKSSLQVQLGASDLFSFEPVDQYMRPLRTHRYVTDRQFMRKYKINEGVEENKQQLASIQSQAINIYHKAQLMNEDELRSLIVKDQFAVNQMYDWVRKKLDIDYIDEKILINDYNKDTTDRQTWELFYIYNKLIKSFLKRVKSLYGVSKKNKSYYHQLEGNVGMILRLMFLKALSMCNNMFYEHREVRSSVPRFISNIWTDKQKLKTIWNHLQIQSPSGFYTYCKKDKLERLWRKFQINELKERSKFFPAERLIITNCVIQETIKMSVSLQKKHIIDYFPLHDPFILKNIEVVPYLSVIKNLRKANKAVSSQLDRNIINKLYSQYECDLTVSDFTVKSIEKQLQFQIFSFKTFQTNCIRAYCGQKIAFYFILIKFLALKAWPLMLPAFIIQCLLWAENSDILSKGTSSLTSFNNVLISIWTFINLFWTTHLIQSWKQQEKKLAQQYGSTKISVNQIKRVKFKGSFKRNFQTDQLNFEYVSKWKSALKGVFTVVINLAYVGLVTEVILLLFLFKTYLYQLGYPQTIVQQAPAILIAIATQVFNKLYTILIKSIINFENHKTVADYQNSLITKVALITFVINFYSIFIFAYFSGYLSSSYICQIKTTSTNVKIQNCDYFVSSQLLSLAMVDFVTTLIGGVTPYLVFKLKEWLQERSTTKTSRFQHSHYESIDSFFQEQDKLDSYRYNLELDNSWVGFLNIVNVFAATALFAPALPFAYVMMFLSGLVRLHASKFDVIFLKKRSLPVKSNSIDWWLRILEIISYISIITNIAYVIYSRNVYPQYQAKIFFLFIIIFFAVKYFLMAQYNTGLDIMEKRNQFKIKEVLLGRHHQQLSSAPDTVVTDIENVYYDQNKLQRKLHSVRGPKVKDNMADLGEGQGKADHGEGQTRAKKKTN